MLCVVTGWFNWAAQLWPCDRMPSLKVRSTMESGLSTVESFGIRVTNCRPASDIELRNCIPVNRPWRLCFSFRAEFRSASVRLSREFAAPLLLVYTPFWPRRLLFIWLIELAVATGSWESLRKRQGRPGTRTGRQIVQPGGAAPNGRGPSAQYQRIRIPLFQLELVICWFLQVITPSNWFPM